MRTSIFLGTYGHNLYQAVKSNNSIVTFSPLSFSFPHLRTTVLFILHNILLPVGMSYLLLFLLHVCLLHILFITLSVPMLPQEEFPEFSNVDFNPLW